MPGIVGSMTVGHEINYHPELVGIRLQAVMAYFDVSKSAFARSIGVTPGAVGNWMAAKHNPDLAAMDKIFEVYGVIGEWIYFGRVFALSDELRAPLTLAEDRIRRSGAKAKPVKSANAGS